MTYPNCNCRECAEARLRERIAELRARIKKRERERCEHRSTRIVAEYGFPTETICLDCGKELP